MLDKSLVYKDIVMCLPFEDLEDLKVPVLPDGYSYKMFESGDEIAWAKLEVLVDGTGVKCGEYSENVYRNVMKLLRVNR